MEKTGFIPVGGQVTDDTIQNEIDIPENQEGADTFVHQLTKVVTESTVLSPNNMENITKNPVEAAGSFQQISTDLSAGMGKKKRQGEKFNSPGT